MKFPWIKILRGYSLPMSIFNWLIIFIWSMSKSGNPVSGLLALSGILAAHAGVNVFDDCIDFICKTPKQKCKTAHLENGSVDLFRLCLIATGCFAYASAIGLYFTFICGIEVAIIGFTAGIICLLYPKLNEYALGEVAVALTFGPLLFAGVNFVMTGSFYTDAVLLSIPFACITAFVLAVHSLMDFDFDKEHGKNTLCVVIGTKKRALNFIFIALLFIWFYTISLVTAKILPVYALLVFGILPVVYSLYINLLKYINEPKHSENDFLENFSAARNLSMYYSLVIAAAILLRYYGI